MWIMTQEGYDFLARNKVTTVYNGNVLSVGDSVQSGDIFTFNVTDRTFTYVSGFDPETGMPLDAVISSDGRTVTVTSPDSNGFNNFNMELSLPDSVKVESVNHVNNVYLLTETESINFIKGYYDIWLGGQNSIDYSKYLLGLIRIPFKIDEHHIVGKATPRLYNVNIGEPFDVLDNDNMVFNAGEITIPAKYNNVLDYEDTDIILHLPFTDSTTIETRYAIGQTLTINYHVNLYNGIATVNVHSTKIDGVIYSENIGLDAKIPFANPNIDVPNVPRNVELALKNSSYTAYVEIVRGEPILPNSEYDATVASEGLLDNIKGFIKVEEIEIVGTATSYEKELIHSILESGVIIK